MSTPLSVKVHVERVLLDQAASDDLRVAFSSEGATVISELPMDSPAQFELVHHTSNIRVSFIRHDNEIASGYIALDPEVEHKHAHRFKDTLVTNVKNLYVQNPKFVADFLLEVDNASPKPSQTEFVQENNEMSSSGFGRSSPLRSTYRGTGKLVPNGETSPLRERINPSHPIKTEKTYKFKEEELHGYLKRVVNSHI